MDEKVTLVSGKYRLTLRVEIKPAQRVSPKLTIDLEPVPLDAQELSIVGDIDENRRDYTWGQCIDAVRAHFGDTIGIKRLCKLWERWHNNGLQAGTRAQLAALRTMPGAYEYDRACQWLEAHDLYQDRGYKYGSAWLYEPLPADVIAEIKAIVSEMKVASK